MTWIKNWLDVVWPRPGDAIARAKARGRRVVAIAAIVALAQAGIVIFAAAGIEAVNILRAYATLEGQWSKAQKRAVIILHNYARSHAERDFDEFRACMAVIAGDRTARETLERASPDMARAEAGFFAGRNASSDVAGLAWGFRLFRTWKPFAAALADWRRADALADSLTRLANGMRHNVLAGAGERRISRALVQASALDQRFTLNESSFSRHMGEASRTAKALVLALLAIVSVGIVSVGAWLAARIAGAGARAEERAEESESRVSDFAELAADWFCEVDENMCVKFVSSRFSRYIAASAEDLLGRNWLEAGEALGFSSLSGGHIRTIRAHQPFRDQLFRLQTKNGREYFWSISGKPLFQPDGTFTGYRIAASDITVLIRTQHDLSRARDQAERANRAKSIFLADMSHELRTPLNAVLGFSELIAREAVGPLGTVKYGEYARDIHASGTRLLAIIDNVLELARVESGSVELREQVFAADDIVDQAIALCRENAARANVALEAGLLIGLPLVDADPSRIKQVLVQLISNAIRFTRKGGTVNVDCRLRPDGALAFQVRDTGIGMSEDGIRQALRPFGHVENSFNRKTEGAGLGLPLAKMLVELHGGLLTVDSAPDQGTCITFTLPPARVCADRDGVVVA